MHLDNGLELIAKKEKNLVACRNCDHSCHCENNGVCVSCKCENCEHNALDEFYKNLT